MNFLIYSIIVFYFILFVLTFKLYRFQLRRFYESIKPILLWSESQGYLIPKRPNIYLCYFIEGKYHWLYFPFGLVFLFLNSRKRILNYFLGIAEYKMKYEDWLNTQKNTENKHTQRKTDKKNIKKKEDSEEVPLKTEKEYFERAIERISNFNTAKAILDLSKCITLNPNNGTYYRYRGLAKKELGDLKEGCEDWILASKLGDKESTTLIKKHSKTIGLIYRSKGLAKKSVGNISGAKYEWEIAKQYGDLQSEKLLQKYSTKEDKKFENTKNKYSNFQDIKRTIFLEGEITDKLADSLVLKLLTYDSEDNTKPIYLFINSPGGSVTAGLSICDTIQYVKAEVHTICNGFSSGMASVILCSGTKGSRYSTRDGRISLCEISTSGEKSIDNKEIKRIEDMIYFILSKNIEQSVERIKDDCNYWSKNQDHQLSPEEAISYGIVDKFWESDIKL